MKNVMWLVLLLIYCGAYAQESKPQEDFKVTFKDLIFDNPYQEKVFTDYFIKDKKDALALFIAASPHADSTDYIRANKRISDFCKTIKADAKLWKKPEGKRVKAIFQAVQDEFFIKYELENYFGNIFINGRFNCVSGTALFALIFEDLGIPYIIKQLPNHVYLVAYPQTSHIEVEATNPAYGYQQVSETFKITYLGMLKQTKVIDDSDMAFTDANKLFEKYFFSSEDIDIYELAGIQYGNSGAYMASETEFEAAISPYEKAYMFYPHNSYKMVLGACYAITVDQKKYAYPMSAIYLVRLANMGGLGVNKEDVVNEFKLLSHNYLTDDPYSKALDTVYENFKLAADNEQMLKEIKTTYLRDKAARLISLSNFDKGCPYARELYKEAGTSEITRQLILGCMGIGITKAKDAAAALDTLNTYRATYDSLYEATPFRFALAHLYLDHATESFREKKMKDGENYLNLFEEVFNYKNDLSIDAYAVGAPYSSASVIYYGNGNFSAARKILERGLKYAPNNYQLQARLKALK